MWCQTLLLQIIAVQLSFSRELFPTSAYQQQSTASAYDPCDGWIWVCDYNNDHFYSTDDVNYVNFIRLRKYGNLSIFECNNGKRIEMIQRCDNTNDCGDNSDEYDCEFLFRNKYQLPNKIPGVYFFHTEKECSSDIKNRFNTKCETDVLGRLNIGCSNNIRVCRRLIQFDSEVGVSNIIILKQKNIDCSPRKYNCSGDFIKKSCLCEELTDCFDGKCEKNCTDNSDFNQINCFSQEATRFPPSGKKLYEKWEAAPLLSTYNINHCSGSLGACGSSCDSISTEYEINYLKTKNSSPNCHKYSTLNDNTKLFICRTRHQLNEDNTMLIICDSQKNKPFSPMCNMDKSLLCYHRESKSFEQIKCRESIIELVENIVESKQQMNESLLLFTMIGSCVSIDYHINGDLVITANPLVNSIKQINQSILDILCCKSDNAAIDWLHGLVFFSLQNSFKIEVMSLNGKFRHSLTDEKIHQPRDITAIPTKRMIIWIDYVEENPVLQIMDMDGTNRRILVKDNIINPSGIAVDLSSDIVYWADISLRAIFCISLNGNNRRTVIKRKLSDPSGLAIVDQHLYWLDWHTKSIQSANKETGEDFKIIRKGLGSAIKIKRLHQSFVPEIINSCGVNNGNCSHICLPMNTSFICKCPYDLKLANDSRTCEASNEIFILMNGVDRLQIIKLNNLTYSHGEILQLNLSQSTSKVDWDNGFIFWSDPCKQVISKIETISSKINIIINHRVVSPSGLAVDWITKKLYFTDSVENTIEVTDYEGQNRTIVIWEKLESPRSLVLDPSTRYMYWISTHEAKPKIEMAGMDGCCRNTFFEGNLKNPVSLTIDMFTRTLYWVDVEKRTIESFPLDKKTKNENSTIILQFNSTMSPHGLAVNKYYLYWTDTNTNTMYKMNKTQNTQVTIDVIRQNITGFKDIQIFNDRQYIAHSFCHFNNGGCSHICLSSPLHNRRSCACPIGYTLEPQNKNKCVIFPSKFILMAHSSKIHMLSFDTPYFKDTILPIKNLKSVSLIGMDNIKGDVYWIDSATSAIFKVNVQNFSNTELVLSNNIYQPESLAIDPMGRRSSLASIYWSDYNRGTIEVVDSDGRNRLILVTNIIGNVRSLAVYPDFSFLYWCTYSKVGKIERVDFDGSNRTLIRSSEKLAGWPIGFSIDKKNNRLYWTDNYFDTLQSTKLDGSDWMTEITGHKYPFGVPFKENMSFWFDINTNQLVKSNQIQSKYVQSTINYLYWVFDIKYYELYKTNPDIVNVCDIDNGGCSHICMRNSHGFKCTCPIGMSLNPHTILCEVETGDQILYAAKSEIGLILLDGSNSLLTQTLNISGAKNVINLDFHWNQKLIYYNDIELKQIRSVSMIEPHNEKVIINEHIRTLNNIAVDWIANNLYFTDSIEGIIEVSKLDGSCRRIIIHEPNEEPWSIAVHPTLGYIFWSDWGTVPKIVKSLTDGSHREVVLQSFINFANSLTIDYVANLIYWTDGVTNNLERCDFEGKNREILIYNNVRPFGIGLLDNSIFFFNWFTLQLEQRDLDAYSFEARMDTNKKEPIDIKVISSSRQRGWNPCAVNNGYCTHLCLYLGRDKHYICECPDKTDGRDCSLKPLKVVEDINDNEDQYQNCLSLLKFIWKAMMFKYTLLSFGVLLIVLGWMFTKQFWINVINFYYEEDVSDENLNNY